MTRKEYQLVFEALKSYKTFMTDQEKVLSEKILDGLFYQDRVDNEIKSLNFRQGIIMTHKLITYRFSNKKWGIYKKYEDVAYIYFSKLEQTLGKQLALNVSYL